MTAVLDVLRTADGEVLATSFVPGAGRICVVLAHGFSGSSAKPAVAPLPLLVVHGDRDGYFSTAHAHALVGAAAGPVELWLEEGFAHAETGASAELVDRLGAHLDVLLERR